MNIGIHGDYFFAKFQRNISSAVNPFPVDLENPFLSNNRDQENECLIPVPTPEEILKPRTWMACVHYFAKLIGKQLAMHSSQGCIHLIRLMVFQFWLFIKRVEQLIHCSLKNQIALSLTDFKLTSFFNVS